MIPKHASKMYTVCNMSVFLLYRPPPDRRRTRYQKQQQPILHALGVGHRLQPTRMGGFSSSDRGMLLYPRRSYRWHDNPRACQWCGGRNCGGSPDTATPLRSLCFFEVCSGVGWGYCRMTARPPTGRLHQWWRQQLFIRRCRGVYF